MPARLTLENFKGGCCERCFERRLSLKMLKITEKRRSKEILYLPNTINCTLSVTDGKGRSFLKSDTTIEYMNSSSLVTGFLKISVAGPLAL